MTPPLRKVSAMSRVAAIVAAFVLMLGAGAAQAQQATWVASPTIDPLGGPAGVLHYGVPETDDSVIDAFCYASLGTQIDVYLYINTGNYGLGQDVPVVFSTTSQGAQTRTGTVLTSDYFGLYVEVLLAEDDSVWRAMAFDGHMNIGVQGFSAAYIDLRGSSAAMQQFASLCNSALGLAPAAGTAPIGQPAYGGVPAGQPVYSAGPSRQPSYGGGPIKQK